MIQLGEKRNAEIAKIIKNYNAKVARLNKKGIDKEKLKSKDVKGAILSGKISLNEFKLIAHNFLSYGEKGLMFEDRTKNRIKLKHETEKLKKEFKERFDTPVQVGKHKTGYNYGQTNDLKLENMKVHIKYYQKLLRGFDFKQIEHVVSKIHKRNEYILSGEFRKVYLDDLEFLANNMGIDVEKVKAMLNDLNNDEFIKFFEDNKILNAIMEEYKDLADGLKDDDDELDIDEAETEENNKEITENLINELEDLLKSRLDKKNKIKEQQQKKQKKKAKKRKK